MLLILFIYLYLFDFIDILKPAYSRGHGATLVPCRLSLAPYWAVTTPCTVGGQRAPGRAVIGFGGYGTPLV